MKANKAVIGGEGNGGVILPEAHYGRDFVGIALFLSLLAEKQIAVSTQKQLSLYFMSKKKIDLNPTIDVDGLLQLIENKYANETLTTVDGVKIDFADFWVHLRKVIQNPSLEFIQKPLRNNKPMHWPTALLLNSKDFNNMQVTPEKNEKVSQMVFAFIYPLCLNRLEKKR